MFYLISAVEMDDKKDFFFSGVLYNNRNELVSEIFDDGTMHSDMGDPYTLILNEMSSQLKNRKYTDKIVSSVRDAGYLFLVSSKAQEILAKLAPDDIKMYKVCIKGSNFEITDYKIVKILDKIDCVDLAKSNVNYKAKFDFISEARSLVLNENKIPDGKKIFLLGKRPTGVIVIHENLRTAIEEAGLTGFYFFSLDEAIKIVN